MKMEWGEKGEEGGRNKCLTTPNPIKTITHNI